MGFGGQGTTPFFGNPDLKPETSTSSELALYWRADAGHGFNLTLFQNTFKDKISSQPCVAYHRLRLCQRGDYATLNYANSSKTVNIDEVQLQGAEVAGRAQLLDSLALRANYTYTTASKRAELKKASLMAISLNTWPTAPWIGKCWIALACSLRWNTAINASVAGIPWPIKPCITKPEVLHLGFHYQILESLRLSGRINNLWIRFHRL